MTNTISYPNFYWLNKDSRKFLSEGDGYLQGGISPENRIRQIGNEAERYLKIEGFADKFYGYMAKGFFSLSSPIWANFGAGRALSISCVTGDSWINTKEGGKQAKDIQIGDEVLTHKGRFKPVTAVIPTKDKNDIYQLKISSRMTPIKITGNHLVMTNTGWKRVDKLDITKDLVAVNGDISFETKEDIIFDMTKFCNFNHVVENNIIHKELSLAYKKSLKREYVESFTKPASLIKLDKDLAWALGLWFAEGSVSIDSKKEVNGARITLCIDEEDIAIKWLKIMTEKFGVNGSYYKSGRKNMPQTWISVNLNSVVVGKFFESFGRGCKIKKISNEIMTMNNDLAQSFVEGLLLGDGTIRKNSNKLTLANPELLLQVYLLGLRLKMEMSLQMQDVPSIYGLTKHVYTIIFRNYNFAKSKTRSTSGVKFYDGLVYAGISEIKKTDLVADVYDFTVEEDHSFSVAGVVVHNCNGSYCPDSVSGIMDKVSEIALMSKHGAGTSIYMGDVRPRGSEISTGGKSDGVVRFLEIFDKTASVISQGGVRRGSLAAYLPIEHEDFWDFMEIREHGHPIQKLSMGLCISDDFMNKLSVKGSEERKRWVRLMEKKFSSGYTYISWMDTINNNAPQVYKDKSKKIYASNLCSEIALSSDKDESFVCCLSSMNLLHYDLWKNTDAVETLARFLDAVMTDYITKTENMPHMQAAHKFAKNQRAIGVGVLGWHSYLQSRMIAFESIQAKSLTKEIFKFMQGRIKIASQEMAVSHGEPPLLEGYGLRWVTGMAIAPTTSSSFILGQVSPSTEPERDNYYIKNLAKGSFSHKNPFLENLLEQKGKNTKEIWKSILKFGGSAQHLDCLTQHEKDVFKAFGEISPYEIILQASIRQPFIDQAQSVNLLFDKDIDPKEVSDLMRKAWELKVKCLYYQRGANPAQEVARKINNCVSCEA